MSGKRVAAIAVAGITAFSCWATAANAQKVLNPTGNLSATATAMSFAVQTASGTVDGTAPSTSVPLFVNGTVAPDGSVNVPMASLSFPSLSLPDQSGSCAITTCSLTGVTLTVMPTGDATGHVNPFTGAGDLSLPVDAQLAGNACIAASCQALTCPLGSSVSPIYLSLTTGTTTASAGYGPITGVPYDEATGTLTLIGDTFTLPTLGSCSGSILATLGAFLNGSLGLPATAGAAKLAATLKLDPILHRGVIAALNPSTTNGTAPLTVKFDASGTQAPAGVSAYKFDLNGDGQPDQTGTSPTATYTYTTPGTYTARLTVTDLGGDSDTITRTISVLAPAAAPRPAAPKPIALPALVGAGVPVITIHGQTITVADGQLISCPPGGPACLAGVTVTTPASQAGDAAVYRGRASAIEIGQATIRAPTGATVPVRFQLNRRGMARLRARHRLLITVHVKLRAGTGGVQSFSRSLVIAWPKRRR